MNFWNWPQINGVHLGFSEELEKMCRKKNNSFCLIAFQFPVNKLTIDQKLQTFFPVSEIILVRYFTPWSKWMLRINTDNQEQ